MMKKQFLLLFLSMFLAALHSCAQKQADSPQELQKKYTIVNRAISAGPDAGSIHLDNADGVGIAWINNTEFTNGTIEADIKGKDVLQASFVGIAFHGVNNTTYETIYFRPFNFRSADPVRKLHAVQYTALPKYEWSVLRQQFPGKYEQSISPAPDPNAWFHARITVDSKTIKVYVNGDDEPSLVVEPLVHTDGKMIGLWTDTDGDYKNFKITQELK
jgi:hypothetical protein